MEKQTVDKDIRNRRLIIKRSFNGAVPRVWQCWTDQELLDKWWGPRLWPCTTKSFDFREGGHWHYCLNGPDGAQSWCWFDYIEIGLERFLIIHDAFSDENGNKNSTMPSTHWRVEFSRQGTATLVTTTLTFRDEKAMQSLIEMGFEAGYTDQLDRLDELLVD